MLKENIKNKYYARFDTHSYYSCTQTDLNARVDDLNATVDVK